MEVSFLYCLVQSEQIEVRALDGWFDIGDFDAPQASARLQGAFLKCFLPHS
jgi:hypothetical protein